MRAVGSTSIIFAMALSIGLPAAAFALPPRRSHTKRAPQRSVTKVTHVAKGRRAGMMRISRRFSWADKPNVAREIEYVAPNGAKEIRRTYRPDRHDKKLRIFDVIRKNGGGKLDGFQETFMLRNGKRRVHRVELRKNGKLLSSDFTWGRSLTALKKALKQEASGQQPRSR